MNYSVNYIDETRACGSCVGGHPIKAEEGFVVTRGNRNPEELATLEAGRRAMQALPGSTLTYKVDVPREVVLAIWAKQTRI